MYLRDALSLLLGFLVLESQPGQMRQATICCRGSAIGRCCRPAVRLARLCCKTFSTRQASLDVTSSVGHLRLANLLGVLPTILNIELGQSVLLRDCGGGRLLCRQACAKSQSRRLYRVQLGLEFGHLGVVAALLRIFQGFANAIPLVGCVLVTQRLLAFNLFIDLNISPGPIDELVDVVGF